MNTTSFKERQKLFQKAAEQNSSKVKDIYYVNKAKTNKTSNNDIINHTINNSGKKLENDVDNKTLIKNKNSSNNLLQNIKNEENIDNKIIKNPIVRNSVHIIRKEMEQMMIKKDKDKNNGEKKEINQNKIINKEPVKIKKENLNEEENKINENNENNEFESNKKNEIDYNISKNEKIKNTNENKIEKININEDNKKILQEKKQIINKINDKKEYEIKEEEKKQIINKINNKKEYEIKEEEKKNEINEDDDSSISSIKKEINKKIFENKTENKKINGIKMNNGRRYTIVNKIGIKNNLTNNIKLEQKSLADLDIDNFKDFKEEYYLNRKYDKTNYDKGKIFFKYRYLKNKYTQINETIRRLTTSQKPSLNKDINIRNDSDDYNEMNISSAQLERFSKVNTINKNFTLSNNVYLSFFIENPSSKCKNSIDKDSELRHYHSQFLKLTENSILYFNLKQYEESYLCLHVNGIIKNLEEFGEFLLVGNGFDKFIIGEFLSKKESPNDKKEVLKGFVSGVKMNYEEINFLECFRFFMKRFYLPKDANLILEITDIFSQIYFDVNKNNEEFVNIFISSNNIYALISTLLAVNTMFTRKDIKNINKITKEDFVNMNKEIQEKFLKDLYDELKNNPLTIAAENYNENVYKRMSTLIKENTSKKSNKNINNDPKQKNNFDISINEIDPMDESEIVNDIFIIEPNDMNKEDLPNLTNNLFTFSEEDKKILNKVEKFHKFVGEDFIHEREFSVPDDFNKLIWGKNIEPNKKRGKHHSLLISDIIDVYSGIDHSDILKKYVKENPGEINEKDHYITIITKKKDINLKSNSLKTALLWYRALKSLVVKVNKESFEKNSKIKNELNSKFILKLEELWKKFILPNWNIYGIYILEKVKNRNEIKEDKLPSLINIKDIMTIVKEIAYNKTLEYFDFFRFYRIGLPPFCRGTIWKILIGNACSITETLFENYLAKIEKVNFKEFEIKYRDDNKTIFNVEYNINQMIIDVIKEKENFKDELIKLQKNPGQIMAKCYNILRIFYIMRNDLIYKKSIISLIYAFLIVEEHEFNTFCKIYNLICNNDIIKFYIDDEAYIKKAIDFFGNSVKSKLPKLHRHFKNLGISYDLFFISWITELFSSSLDFKLWLRIIDLYLIDGEYILYQAGITILSMQEDDLLDLAISDILNLIKRLPNKYEIKYFLQKMKNYEDIKNECIKWKNEDEIGTQKLQLFETIFNDDN